jgi:type II secretory pathway pseudopilin PulG
MKNTRRFLIYHHDSKRSSSGLTLVELLVVITIFIMLVAVVLPLAKPALKGRSARESVRQLSTMLMAAQSRAISLRKPQGIILRIADAQGNDAACYSVTAIQYPPPTFQSFVCQGRADSKNPYRVLLTAADHMRLSQWISQRQKFLFRLGNDFTPYTFVGISPGPVAPFWVELGPIGTTAGLLQATPVFANVPPSLAYGESLRMFYFPPTAPRYTSSGTIQFPSGAYVDLRWSGIGTTKQIPVSSTINTLAIMYAPDGKIAWIHTQLRDVVTGNIYPLANAPIQPLRVTDDIHLLVSNAKRKTAQDPLLPTSGSFWVTINPRTGGVSSSENLGSVNANVDQALLDSRRGITKTLTVAGN